MSLLQDAAELIENGFSVLPITKTKQPNISSWGQYQHERPMIENLQRGFESAYGVAIIAGNISGNLEAIDIDTKYDLTGKMFYEFCQLVKDDAPDLLPKMCVAQTMNGGFHFIYRLPDGICEGNKKLASRPASAEETAKGDKVKVLFETRGEGGYFAVAPTPGYAIKRGSLFDLQTITKQERELLFTFARSFDQMPAIPEPQEIKVKERTSSNEISTFDDYNNRAEIPSLLIKHGWKQVSHKGSRIYFQRPGETDSPISANYDTKRRIFYVFSTSTVFDAERGYNPTQVYTVLEHNRDYSAASKELFREGFGKRTNSKIKYAPRREQSSEAYKWLVKYEEHKRKMEVGL